MKLLITGATGTIGRVLCQQLLEQGDEVRILTRRAGPSPIVGTSAWQWNPLTELPPSASLEGIDAIVHLAGEPVAQSRWTEEVKRRIRDSRVIGTRNLVEGIKAMDVRPRVLVGASAVGFYGSRGDERLTESSPEGIGFLPDVCREWELSYEPVEQIGVRLALIRIGVVLSRSGGVLEKMLLPFRLGLGGRLGSGRQWFPWIHIDDLIGLIQFALTNDQIRGVLNGASEGSVTNEQFTKCLAQILNRPAVFGVPEPALRLLAGELASVVLASQLVVPQAALEVGYNFKFKQVSAALHDIIDSERT